jgi:hypothetical protein
MGGDGMMLESKRKEQSKKVLYVNLGWEGEQMNGRCYFSIALTLDHRLACI